MSGTQLRQYLDDQAATVTLPPDLAEAVRRRATTRRRHRATAVVAVLAAGLSLGAALGPTLQRSIHADVVDSPADGRAVVPRTVPPLGRFLPTLADHPLDRVSVAWTSPDPSAIGNGEAIDRLIGLDAVDGQPVVLARQIEPGTPVVVSPDGRSVAVVVHECAGHRGSIDVVVPAVGGSGGFGNCNVELRRTGYGVVASPALAWSPDSSRLAAVVQVPGHGEQALVYPQVSRTGQVASGGPDRLPGPAVGVAWAPGGLAVRRPDHTWDLVTLGDHTVTALPSAPGLPRADTLAWSADGRGWAQGSWASGRLRYWLDRWPTGDAPTTGSFAQALTPADRWLVPSGSRFLGLAGPFGNAVGDTGVGLGVPDSTSLPRVIQSLGRTAGRGLAVSEVAFTGEQTISAVGVAGDLLVDPTSIATVPDDGQRSWVQVAGWAGLAALGLVAAGWLVAARRRRSTLT